MAAQASLFLVRRSPVYVEVAIPGCSSLSLFLLLLFTLICSAHSPLQCARERTHARTQSPSEHPQQRGANAACANMWFSCVSAGERPLMSALDLSGFGAVGSLQEFT